MIPFDDWCDLQLEKTQKALSSWVPEHAPAGLGLAMRYAALDGGKGLRPLLVLACAQAVGGNPEAALRAACAVELIHAYSLVHDDMPCMDNDVMRRNKPTVHVAFGQATALLAGDAMQALAFEMLATPHASIDTAIQARLCYLLATSAGHAGMAGGQAIDLASVGCSLSIEQLREMHTLKTGALIEASVMMGAACGAIEPESLHHLQTFGRALGLAFQVVDDILDVTADSATLGKTSGKDAAQEKPTYVSVMGLNEAIALTHTLHDQATTALQATQLADVSLLLALSNWVIHRQH